MRLGSLARRCPLNIFVLDKDPDLAARYQCDKHVIKMILETAQLLCSVFEPGQAPYKRTHYNHPSAVWTRASRANYMWLIEHGEALCYEYTRRYKKSHKSEFVFQWCRNQPVHEILPDVGELTPFAQAMPEQYKNPDDAVAAYRAYYKGEKARFAVWTPPASPPDWW